jgi:3-oxoacyl-[acyl-carrier-protein] synthase II
VTACASGAHAIGEALRILERGDADVMLAGGTEAAVNGLVIAGFSSMQALSRRNDEPERASRPFDQDRDGFVLGEGAGVLVLETEEHARKRGATIHAECVGYGSAFDAFAVTQPEPEGRGAVLSMREALKDAGMSPDEVDYISAHGTSTVLNDLTETVAVKKLFGARAPRVPMSSIKSMVGHLIGAAGALEAIVSVLAIRDGILPPTINLENPDPQCDLDYVPNEAREARVRTVLSNSFGFGGQNASLVIREYAG